MAFSQISICALSEDTAVPSYLIKVAIYKTPKSSKPQKYSHGLAALAKEEASKTEQRGDMEIAKS